MARKTIDEYLEEARRRLRRVTPREALDAARAGAVLVDTRSEDQRLRQGFMPGAISHPLSVLLWRLDPDCPTSNEKIPLDAEVILICREGYSSTFAALQLREIGFENVADVIGGVDAWKASGLPIIQPASSGDGQPHASTAQLDEPIAGERGDGVSVERG
jgi:rhodanese-related sulfurtransferase